MFFQKQTCVGQVYQKHSWIRAHLWIQLLCVTLQYRLDGYSVFVVRGGNLPPPSSEGGPYGDDTGNADPADW